jgi:hypothetical protein
MSIQLTAKLQNIIGLNFSVIDFKIFHYCGFVVRKLFPDGMND